MRLLALLLLSAGTLHSQQLDPVEIARRTVANYQADQLSALRYSFTEVDDDKSKGVEISEVTTVEGTPYERPISRQGKPLTPEEAERERQKFEQAVAERSKETTEQRDKRRRNFEQNVKFLEEAPEAFDFKILDDEIVAGRPSYVIECTPKPGFHPHNLRSKLFTKLQVRAWVDKQDLRIIKIHADVSDAVAMGWVLARVAKGTHMEMEQMRLDDGSWVLKRLSVDGRAKILLVDNKRWQETVTYDQYHPASKISSASTSR